MHDDFHTKVGARYGLTRQRPPKRLSASVRRNALESARAVLKAHSGLTDAVLRVLLAPHEANPLPLLAALGLPTPVAVDSKGSFAKTMTKPCKPEKSIGFAAKKSIGFGATHTAHKEQTLCSVGFAEITVFPAPLSTHASASNDASPITSNGQQQGDADAKESGAVKAMPVTVTVTPEPIEDTAEEGHRFARVRDADQRSEYWDESLGEFRCTAKAKSGKRVAAAVAVDAALVKLKKHRDEG